MPTVFFLLSMGSARTWNWLLCPPLQDLPKLHLGNAFLHLSYSGLKKLRESFLSPRESSVSIHLALTASRVVETRFKHLELDAAGGGGTASVVLAGWVIDGVWDYRGPGTQGGP